MTTCRGWMTACHLLTSLGLGLTSLPVTAVPVGPSVDLINTGGWLQTDTSVQGAGSGTITDTLPAMAFQVTDSLSTNRQSSWAPEPTYGWASATASFNVGAYLNGVSGDVVLFGDLSGSVATGTVPECDQYGCAYALDTSAGTNTRYRLWFDLLEPMSYFLRVEFTPGTSANAPDSFFEFNSLIRDRTLLNISGADIDAAPFAVLEQSGNLSDGYHELLSELSQYVRISDESLALTATANGRIRYWLSLNATMAPTPVPAPGGLLLLATAVAFLGNRISRSS